MRARANDSSIDKNELDTAAWDDIYQDARAAVAPWLGTGRAVIMRQFAEAAVLSFPDDFFDWIYIDAGHEFTNVMRDLRLWFPKLKSGGMIAGDDFADEHDSFPHLHYHSEKRWGVKSAVAQFSRSVGSPFFLTYADRKHTSTEVDPNSTTEWDADCCPARACCPPAQRRKFVSVPLDARVRSHQMYPAWYMFK